MLQHTAEHHSTAAAVVPCCAGTDHPEGSQSRALKCHQRGMRKQCGPSHRLWCAIGCGFCRLCASHPRFGELAPEYRTIQGSSDAASSPPPAIASFSNPSATRRQTRIMRRAGRVNASEAIPCPAVSPPAHPQCLLSTFGSDGAGRRIEASLSCVAAAHDLGVQYVHMPFLKLEHHTSAGHANRFLGMDFLAERCRWPTVRATKAESNCGKCPPAAVVPSTFKLVPFKSDLVGKEDCAAGRASADWLGDLLQDPARCAQDGGSLHVGYHCFGYFWCTVRGRHEIILLSAIGSPPPSSSSPIYSVSPSSTVHATTLVRPCAF